MHHSVALYVTCLSCFRCGRLSLKLDESRFVATFTHNEVTSPEFKAKLSPCLTGNHATKTLGIGGITPCILSLDMGRDKLDTSAVFPVGKATRAGPSGRAF
jgi:hypothetical protein